MRIRGITAVALAAILASSTLASGAASARDHGDHGRYSYQQGKHHRGAQHYKFEQRRAAQYNKHRRAETSRAYQRGLRDGDRRNDYNYRSVRYNGNNGRYWWGDNGRINCRRDNGTTGTIVGAIGGGVLGNLITHEGDKTIGTVVGGALGALLGRQLDSGSVRCR